MFQSSSGLDGVHQTLDELAREDLSEWSDPALHALVGDLCRLQSKVQSLLASAVAPWDARVVWADDGSRSGPAWLRSYGELEAPGRTVKHARALRDWAPRTSAALAAGELSYTKAAAIVTSITSALAPAFADSEEIIVETAKQLTVAQVRRLVSQWRAIAENDLDPEADADEERRAQRTLRIWETFDGLGSIEGVLDMETLALVKTHVEARARRLWRQDVREARIEAGLDPDEQSEAGLRLARTHGQRMADALGDLVRAGAESLAHEGDDDRVGGPATQLHLTAPTELVVAAAAARVERTLALPGLGSEEEAAYQSALDRLGPSYSGARLLGAPVAVPDGSASALDGQNGVPGVPDLPVPRFDGLDSPVEPGLVDLLACDSRLQRVLLDPRGVPVDVGRAERFATPAQRRALILRDGATCGFPGCDLPASWCDAHHIIPWPLGGLTDLINLVLLCRFHHRLMHAKRPWRCWIDPAIGFPQYFRPDGELARLPGLFPPMLQPRAA